MEEYYYDDGVLVESFVLGIVAHPGRSVVKLSASTLFIK